MERGWKDGEIGRWVERERLWNIMHTWPSCYMYIRISVEIQLYSSRWLDTRDIWLQNFFANYIHVRTCICM